METVGFLVVVAALVLWHVLTRVEKVEKRVAKVEDKLDHHLSLGGPWPTG